MVRRNVDDRTSARFNVLEGLLELFHLSSPVVIPIFSRFATGLFYCPLWRFLLYCLDTYARVPPSERIHPGGRPNARLNVVG